MEKIKSPLCAVCGVPFANRDGEDHLCGDCSTIKRPYASARSVLAFNGSAKESIHRMKYNSLFSVVEPLGEMLARIVEEGGARYEDALLVPVPLHRLRLKERGFNQSLLLARAVSKKLSLDLDFSSLKRSKATRSQIDLSGKEREENVKNAFILDDPEMIKGRKTLIIDDVYTTGSTVSECAKTLKQASSEVHVLTLARAIRL